MHRRRMPRWKAIRDVDEVMIKDETAMKKYLPSVFLNPVSLAGSLLAAISFGLILFLMLLEFLSRESKPYVGILAFVILPMFLVAGLFLISYGAYREHERRKRGEETIRKFPVVDFNDPKHRFAFTIFVFVTIIFLLFTAFGSYKAYEYTDSDEFCGQVCHKVMEPEYTAYQDSPHSRVGCAKCHIGAGADWFVKAKISGSYQLYSVTFNKYSRPIPTPIENLRPAQQTCEQCHWPKHFYSEKKLERDYFLPDENNSHESMTMLLKIGEKKTDEGVSSGIHWHVNSGNEIYYGVPDKSRQNIPVVIWKDKNGKEEIYTNTKAPVEVIENAKKEMRKMDCIDCHNRPSHIYHEPNQEVNHALSMGLIDVSLPYIKTVAVQALEKEYANKETALQSISDFISTFYSGNYSTISSSKAESITQAIAAVQKIYSRNYFPEMKADWRHYPNNIGHMYYDGCFRCHDGQHRSASGKVIGNKCENCHTIIAQETPSTGKISNISGLAYTHPGELNGAIQNQKCTVCHGVNRSRN